LWAISVLLRRRILVPSVMLGREQQRDVTSGNVASAKRRCVSKETLRQQRDVASAKGRDVNSRAAKRRYVRSLVPKYVATFKLIP
jgi:hypothetical protein